MNLIKKINVDIDGNVKTTYLCDGQEILPESYYSLEADLEDDMDFEDCNECDGDCENCDGCDDYDGEEGLEQPCDCIDCTLDRYRDMILEVAPCPACVREVLAEFLVCVVDHVVVEE